MGRARGRRAGGGSGRGRRWGSGGGVAGPGDPRGVQGDGRRGSVVVYVSWRGGDGVPGRRRRRGASEEDLRRVDEARGREGEAG